MTPTNMDSSIVAGVDAGAGRYLSTDPVVAQWSSTLSLYMDMNIAMAKALEARRVKGQGQGQGKDTGSSQGQGQSPAK